jgi:undecaprenyl-diphosphatase
VLPLIAAALLPVPAGCSSAPPADPAPPPAPALTVGQAAILGLVEGLTEYLPVSSTGHLSLTSHFLGLRDLPEPQARAVKAYEIVIQFGAILAVFLLYAERIGGMVLGMLGQSPSGRRMLFNLLAAFVPFAVIAFALEKLKIIERLQSTGPVVFATFVGGVAIILFERSHHAGKSRSSGGRLDSLQPQTAAMIGLIQCLALWPGTSRSMVTIIGGMLLGLNAVAAAEFSFLLGLASLSAAGFYKLLKDGSLLREQIGVEAMLTGIIVSTIAATAAVSAFVSYLNRRGLEPFGWYRLALAVAMLLVLGLSGGR